MRLLFTLSLLVLARSQSVIAAETGLFHYDSSAPLAVHEIGREQRRDAIVRDLTFVGVKDPIKAFLVAPAQPGPTAAILYVHWLGETATTNRTEFLDEAVGLASRGVTSLLVDAMWSDPQWWDARKPETDFAGGVNQVIELRRALDLLLSQPGVDPKRLALVGHDFGAMFGSVMGAADGRPHCYVLMAPTPHLSDWYLFNVKPASLDAYKKELSPLDPIDAVKHLSPAPVFFQFASHDKYVAGPRSLEFYDAASPRKQMATYDSDHDLVAAEVGADRVAWLARQLQFAQ